MTKTMYFINTALLCLSVFKTSAAASFSAPSPATRHARAAFVTLQSWYNISSGTWDTTGWWNSANCLTTTGDLAAIDSKVRSIALHVFANTYVQGQKNELQLVKSVTNSSISSCYGPSCFKGLDTTPIIYTKGFLNDYYDDEGWWALAFIQAYDVAHEPQYLSMAMSIFEDMKKGSTTPCHGGIWWDKPKTYVNAIANELFMSVAAHLANRCTKARMRRHYLRIALEQWKWFQDSGMINHRNLINDGLTEDCINNNGTVWSYNQGVILGALVETSIATRSQEHIHSARKIARAAIAALSDADGILHDSCEPDCGADGSQFKGIFMRNLRKLAEVYPETGTLHFINHNARSIWFQDRRDRSELGLVWSGPHAGSVNASTQSSALDALVAAAPDLDFDLDNSQHAIIG
ncbi:glycosyl hydrolase [Phlyctema vagabunda]|uniref:Glycosyl hydrolase n=1 Tax=Phlyctema vagabunda TaxID=108571 RepID=A0ABR4PCF3_9HELO